MAKLRFITNFDAKDRWIYEKAMKETGVNGLINADAFGYGGRRLDINIQAFYTPDIDLSEFWARFDEIEKSGKGKCKSERIQF